MIVRDVLDAAARSIRKRAADATPWDARLLLAHSIGHGRPLVLEPREELPVEAESRFEALWEKRLASSCPPDLLAMSLSSSAMRSAKGGWVVLFHSPSLR